MLARIQNALMDNPTFVWDTPTLTEGLRLSLGEYNLAGRVENPVSVLGTINGLDGAVTSNLTVYESLVVLGAAGYCASARAVDRASSYEMGDHADQLKAWGDARLKEFRAQLGAVFPKYMGAVVTAGGADDPTKIAAEVLLMTAQASLADAEAAASTGQESRAAAAAVQAAADRVAEANGWPACVQALPPGGVGLIIQASNIRTVTTGRKNLTRSTRRRGGEERDGANDRARSSSFCRQIW